MKYKGTIRELEYWDYDWIVEADSKEGAVEKILQGNGTIEHFKFVEGSDLSDRDEAISNVRLVVDKEK